MMEINPSTNWPAQHCQTKGVSAVRRLILPSHGKRAVTGGGSGSYGPEAHRVDGGTPGLGAVEGLGSRTLQWRSETDS